MVITDLTYDERRRFRNASVCPICRSFIEDFDSFEKVVVNYKRYKIATFMHTNCVISFHNTVFHRNYAKGVSENEKEETFRIESSIPETVSKGSEEV